MTEREALKLALEALVEVESWKSPIRWDGCFDKEITAIKEALSSCQCPECRLVLHASDCAVHNEPAYLKGECNCGAQPEPWEKFCDSNCVWTDHHPDCKLAQRLPLTDDAKDAARYRWLRDSNTDVALVIDKRTEWVPPDDDVAGVGGYWMYEYRCGSELDEAIDRAIEAAHGIKGEA